MQSLVRNIEKFLIKIKFLFQTKKQKESSQCSPNPQEESAPVSSTPQTIVSTDSSLSTIRSRIQATWTPVNYSPRHLGLRSASCTQLFYNEQLRHGERMSHSFSSPRLSSGLEDSNFEIAASNHVIPPEHIGRYRRREQRRRDALNQDLQVPDRFGLV